MKRGIVNVKHCVWLTLLMVLGIAFRSSPAAAIPRTELVVDSLADAAVTNNNCTLREAVQAANSDTAVDGCAAGSGMDTITLAVDGTIFLENTLSISDGLSIRGNGQARTLLDGKQERRVLRILDGGRFAVQLHDLTIQNGAAPEGEYGGGILNITSHALSLSRVTLQNNAALRGGGVYSFGGQLTIQEGTFVGNSAVTEGGAVHHSHAPFVARQIVVRANEATRGGGLHLRGDLFEIHKSTLNDNSATEGGGIYLDGISIGSLTLSNSTVSGNHAGERGGGIYVDDGQDVVATLRNSTVYGNQNSGVFLANGIFSAAAVFDNTLLAANAGGNCAYSAAGTNQFGSVGYNLSDDTSPCGLDSRTDIVNVDSLLQTLADNGGPTQTHALHASSPAIDAGNCSGESIADDQRGVARPQRGGCDIGAFEYEGQEMIYLPLVIH